MAIRVVVSHAAWASACKVVNDSDHLTQSAFSAAYLADAV